MCAHFKWRERKSQFMVDLNELVQKKVLLMFAFILYCGKERKRPQKWKKKHSNELSQPNWTHFQRNPDGKHHIFISLKLFICWKIVALAISACVCHLHRILVYVSDVFKWVKYWFIADHCDALSYVPYKTSRIVTTVQCRSTL